MMAFYMMAFDILLPRGFTFPNVYPFPADIWTFMATNVHGYKVPSLELMSANGTYMAHHVGGETPLQKALQKSPWRWSTWFIDKGQGYNKGHGNELYLRLLGMCCPGWDMSGMSYVTYYLIKFNIRLRKQVLSRVCYIRMGLASQSFQL